MSDIPTKTYPPECLHTIIADHEAEQAGATSEASSAVETKGDTMSDIERLTVERDAAYISIESLRNTLAEQDHELDMAREDVLRLTSERDTTQAEVERLQAKLAGAHALCRALELSVEQADAIKAYAEASAAEEEAETDRVTAERDAAQAEVERLTAERDTARAEVRRLIAERDQPESRPKGREVGRFGLDGHYLNAMEPTRPTDEDIWREAFITMLPSYPWEKAAEHADRVLPEYRKRWPR